MQTVTLGRTGLEVSVVVGPGCGFASHGSLREQCGSLALQRFAVFLHPFAHRFLGVRIEVVS